MAEAIDLVYVVPERERGNYPSFFYLFITTKYLLYIVKYILIYIASLQMVNKY